MSRVQLALRVADLEGSIDFYRSLFGVEPAKRRPGYANFAIAEPPLKLVLIEGEPEPGHRAGPPRRRGRDHRRGHRGDRPGWPGWAWPPWRRTTPPAATRCRTRCGCTGPATSRGRSTPSRPTPRRHQRARRRLRRDPANAALPEGRRSPGLARAARRRAPCRATAPGFGVLEANRRTAGLAVQRATAFADGDGGQAERDHGIGPPPAERGVEDQADEHRGREVGAQQRLPRVGDRAGRAELAPRLPLRPRQERHDHDADRHQDDADGRALGLVPDRERRARASTVT